MSLYSGLKDGEIRLLHFNTSFLTASEAKIRCTLETYKLKSVSIPDFSALSYTWGSPHPDPRTLCDAPWSAASRLICNGAEVEVTENLYNFLHEYIIGRSQHLHDGCLWIDALCINQANSLERSDQVKLMARIYQSASRVIVWLGPGDRMGDSGLDLLFGLVTATEGERTELHPLSVRTGHENYLLNLRCWESLIRFFQRTWFNRVWVIQEVVFAATTIVWCGGRSIPFDDIGIVSGFLATSVWTNFMKDPHLAPNQKGIKCWHNTPTRLIASKDKWVAGGRDGFLHALIRARKSNCQDDRDKVYSQLGLGNAELYPRYTTSVAEVYIDTARYLLEQSGKLLILTCVEGCQRIPGLPSWVPDWSLTKYVGLGITGYPQFKADDDQCPTYVVKKEGLRHILRLRARKIDDIIMTCEAKEELQDSLSSSGLWSMMERIGPSYRYLTEQSGAEVIWRSLITNRGTIPPPERVQYPASPNQLAPSFRAWIIWRYASVDEEPRMFPSWSSKSKILPSRLEIESARVKSRSEPTYLIDLAREASIFHFAYTLATELRPFLTQREYFGIGTRSLEEADSIWIILGCCVPLILRSIPGGSRYRLIGGAYVHGVMNGEAVSNSTEIDYKTIELE